MDMGILQQTDMGILQQLDMGILQQPDMGILQQTEGASPAPQKRRAGERPPFLRFCREYGMLNRKTS